jgi:hypothetical protein
MKCNIASPACEGSIIFFSRTYFYKFQNNIITKNVLDMMCPFHFSQIEQSYNSRHPSVPIIKITQEEYEALSVIQE